MPIFLDLDNTLVDRDAAFALWAERAMPAWGGRADDVAWLIHADDGGYAARSQLAQTIIERLQPVATDVDALVASMRTGLLEHLECYPGVLDQVERLQAMGQSVVVVTNGDPDQQRRKLDKTGLSRVITRAVISGELGFKKPDPRIFEAALALSTDDGVAWMVGDHVTADIAGARALGWSTAWVGHGREWPEQWAPTVTAREPAETLALVRRSIQDAR
ncbi:HAD family hydrolase [Herbiconiux liangxiaofengii]|uniref:HAD family hydrolase n=1 Tax=Herbiconiux liangxiaofengii TaxID=3342795 RepID=UPI0035B81A6A